MKKGKKNLNKLLQGWPVQAGVVGQEVQLLQLEVVSVVALSLSLQELEDDGPNQQVREVGQSQKYCPAHFDPDQLEPRHQPPPAPEWTEVLMLELQKGLTTNALMKYADLMSSSPK